MKIWSRNKDASEMPSSCGPLNAVGSKLMNAFPEMEMPAKLVKCNSIKDLAKDWKHSIGD